MSNALSTVLNMTMTGSIVIMFVVLVRFLLKTVPKIFSYALWSVVLFRLLCPVSFSAPVSLLDLFKPETVEASDAASIVYFIPPGTAQELDFVPAATAPEAGDLSAEPAPGRSVLDAAPWFWVTVSGAMLVYGGAEYLRLRKKLIGAMKIREHIYLADGIDMPFVLGILRPMIYLPSTLPENEHEFIIAHERHHIRRGDHILKMLAFLALCVHWFNPLVWLAFVLAGRDMEMSCDEAVIRQMGPNIRADYSAALLRLATHRKIIAGTPLAFGEGNTKGRVLNMAKWKKPGVWVSALCVLLCVGVLAACAVNPGTGKETEPSEPKGTAPSAALPVQTGVLPEGYSLELTADGSQVFTDGTQTVGGVMFYPIPEGIYDPEDAYFSWLEEVGIPDFEDSSLCYMGGITSGEGWAAEFASDVPPGTEPTVSRRHRFLVSGNYVLDIWVDLLKMDHKTADLLLHSVCIAESAPTGTASPDSPEEAAFQKCAAVFRAVQGETYQILHLEKYESTSEPAGYSHIYWQNRNDWMHIRTTLDENSEEYNREASMCFVGHYYADRSRKSDGADIIWEESDPIDTVPQPWLARFYWSKANVTYMDTLIEGDGSTILYRIDKRYEDLEGYSDCYFAAFRFDNEGRFQEVVLDVNLYQDNAFTVTESIVSLDGTVVTDIYRQYALASGAVETVADHPLDSCQGVVEAIQGMDAWKIVTDRRNIGADALNDRSTMNYWKHGKNWLHTNAIPESDATMVMASCYIDGKYYDTYGPEAGASPEGEPIAWQEVSKTESCVPWLAVYEWNGNAVTVTNVDETADGTAVHLHFKDTFRLGSLEANEYTAVFLFDRTGRFVSATVTVGFPNRFSITETMRIASIDADAIVQEMADLVP